MFQFTFSFPTPNLSCNSIEDCITSFASSIFAFVFVFGIVLAVIVLLLASLKRLAGVLTGNTNPEEGVQKTLETLIPGILIFVSAAVIVNFILFVIRSLLGLR